jgi:lipopolysaccharide export system permease protein
MILSKIWERMLFFRAFKFILFFLASIYLVYVVIDLSAHSGRLFSSSISFFTLLLYYLHHFLARLDLFLPLSLLLATISLLFSMNLHHEIVSLRMAGISLKKLSRPLFLIAFLFTSLSYLNYEYLFPKSMRFIETFKETNLHRHSKKKPTLQMAPLLDGSKIIYQYYDPKKREFFDLFWIRSHSDIWHIKTLSLDSKEGKFTDHLIRKNSLSPFEKKESFPSRIFTEISFALISNETFFLSKENLSISSLWNQKIFLSRSDKVATQSHLYYKFVMPWLSPLALLCLLPFCVKFSRNLQIFFLTAIALFVFFIFITLMDSCVILGENQALSPFFALCMPPLLGLFLFGWRFFSTKQ